jgi:MFS transporter, UMF1 family
MLLAFFIYGDAIGAIIRMATGYGAEIGLERDIMITAILLTQLIGFPFAIIFGVAATKFGAKPLVFVGIGVYVVISVLGYRMTTATHFLLLAMLVGTVQGGTQALSRSLFATLVPRHKSGEFFGFFGVIERFSGVMGIMVMWAAGVITGSPRPGILALIVFFVIGGLLLRRWTSRRGRGRRERRRARRGCECCDSGHDSWPVSPFLMGIPITIVT